MASLCMRGADLPSPLAHPWIIHVYPQDFRPAGTGAAAREVLHGMGVEMGYPG